VDVLKENKEQECPGSVAAVDSTIKGKKEESTNLEKKVRRNGEDRTERVGSYEREDERRDLPYTTKETTRREAWKERGGDRTTTLKNSLKQTGE